VLPTPPCTILLRVLLLIGCLQSAALGRCAPTSQPVWLISNGLHTSFVFRVADLPFASEIRADPRADKLIIGWGAADVYRSNVNPWTLCKAVLGAGESLLHIVSLRGSIAGRFAHSDIVELDLPRAEFQKLAHEIDHAFRRDACGRRILSGPGYYGDSRFYAGADHFHIVRVCNTWVAGKLHRSGVPIFVPTSIFAPELVRQASKFGQRQQYRSLPRDGF